MGKKALASKEPKDTTELVVSTYWPTRIIKSITIRDLTETYGNSITLDRGQAKYIYEQLKTLYGESEESSTNNTKEDK